MTATIAAPVLTVMDTTARVRAHLDAHPERLWRDVAGRTLAEFSLRELAEAAGISREGVRQVLQRLKVTLTRRCPRCEAVFEVDRGNVRCPECRPRPAPKPRHGPPLLTRAFTCAVCGEPYSRTGKAASIAKSNARKGHATLCGPACVSEVKRRTLAATKARRQQTKGAGEEQHG